MPFKGYTVLAEVCPRLRRIPLIHHRLSLAQHSGWATRRSYNVAMIFLALWLAFVLQTPSDNTAQITNLLRAKDQALLDAIATAATG